MKSKYKALIILFIFASIVVGIWFWQNYQVTKDTGIILPKHKVKQETQTQSLGAAVYEKQQNPTLGQIPETNPIKEVYKNPFE